jgi:hypothetical protein
LSDLGFGEFRELRIIPKFIIEQEG